MASPKNLELQLYLSYAGNTQTFTVTARLPSENLTQVAQFSLQLNEDQLAAARTWMESGRADDPNARAFGATLFERLFTAPIRDLYRRARSDPESVVRLRLFCDGAYTAESLGVFTIRE
ncbi:MAG: hypothetical protein IPK16_13665 [Anaerolineales bacterium]|nr:hypothetical protein [Anaerolineales bacterium]